MNRRKNNLRHNTRSVVIAKFWSSTLDYSFQKIKVSWAFHLTIEFFLNNRNLTFLAFLYKIDRLSKLAKYTTSLFGLRSFLDSIEHDFIRVWKSDTGKEWHSGWVGKAVRILIQWWLVLRVWFPLETTLFFAETLNPCCQFCTQVPEMSDLCY